MSKLGSAFKIGAIAAAMVALATVSTDAHFIPAPCDFITGGGFIFRDDGARANFGAHGGCKKNGPDAPFWGHVNYVDHGGLFGTTPYHLNSTEITGYLFDPAFPNARDICGFARDNRGNMGRFRVRMEDNGEPGINDRFGICYAPTFYVVRPRELANGGPGGGNIKLHKPNPSTPSPCPADNPFCISEFEMCGGLTTPEEGCGLF
jgi:hypothetical protein